MPNVKDLIEELHGDIAALKVIVAMRDKEIERLAEELEALAATEPKKEIDPRFPEAMFQNDLASAQQPPVSDGEALLYAAEAERIKP